MGDIPRHDLKPSQYLKQLKDVTVDHTQKQHLLKTIPPRLREIMGKEVEDMSAQEVATMAESFFDRQGRPLEKISNPINHVSSASSASSNTSSNASSSSNSSSSTFTTAFNDEDETDVNFVRRNGGRNGQQQRGRSRNSRSQSCPNFKRNSSNASSTRQNQQDNSSSTHPPGTCRFHRCFGDKSLKCVTDCPCYKSFLASQGKRGPTSVNGDPPPSSSSSSNIKNNLLYVHNASTKQKWLIDGGAVL